MHQKNKKAALPTGGLCIGGILKETTLDLSSSAEKSTPEKRTKNLVPEWKENLGRAPLSVETLIRILEDYPHLTGGKVELNKLSNTPELNRKPLTDNDITELRVRVSDKFALEKQNGWFSPLFVRQDAWDACLAVANRNSFHPVKEYIDSLRWDGQERIRFILPEILGNEEPEEVEQTMLRRWLIAAVARVQRPGCKVDNVLVLAHSRQGIGKSSFFRVLAGKNWFTDASIDPTSRDGIQTAAEHWFWEWGELSAMRKARDLEAVKAFLTRAEDCYVAKYERAVTRRPRSFVVCATANHTDILADDQNRRFWPVRCGEEIDLKSLSKERDQIWAEAAAYQKLGERWWFDNADNELLKDYQRKHGYEEEHPWQESVERMLASGRFATNQAQLNDSSDCKNDLIPVTPSTIMDELKLAPHQQDSNKAREIGKILRRIGWFSTGCQRHRGVVIKPYLWRA
jgi:predicted P-loop ATPase